MATTITATLDHVDGVYAPGDKMTLKVVVSPAEARDKLVSTPGSAHVSVDNVGSADVSFTLVRADGHYPITVTDPDRPWALSSDDPEAGVTYFTATA